MTGRRDVLLSLAETAAVSWWFSLQMETGATATGNARSQTTNI